MKFTIQGAQKIVTRFVGNNLDSSLIVVKKMLAAGDQNFKQGPN